MPIVLLLVFVTLSVWFAQAVLLPIVSLQNLGLPNGVLWILLGLGVSWCLAE